MLSAEIEDAAIELSDSLSQQASSALHWVHLTTGQFFQSHEKRFRREKCADQTLLANLRFVRKKLHEQGLDYDAIHDLLARIIFIQYLFHRKDSLGNPALNLEHLEELFNNDILSCRYTEFAEILSNYSDSYALFRFLNGKFNGDLFPGEPSDWQDEMQHVKPVHLELLADFVAGNMEMEKGQMSFWPHYSFDAIPLEFISSIYEVFVSKKEDQSAVYTPAHVVDFVLDGVLPWDGDRWDVKLLDPACGSGIFLVKAFQRLIYRWHKTHPAAPPKVKINALQDLLERNIFGIDVNEHAVRVASFSLYLAMCDEIDPRYYWQDVHFPQLRNRQFIKEDFFDEDKTGFRTHEDVNQYDLIIGNPPWGKGSVTSSKAAKEWAKENKWAIANWDIGPLFLPKACALAKQDAQIVMLQPATSLLFNQGNPAKNFREKFFHTFKVEEIVNLSTLRFGLFRKQALSPTCVVTLQPIKPDGSSISYISPKATETSEDRYRIIVEPGDINQVYVEEAASDPFVWSALVWGGRRDLAFIKRLASRNNILKLISELIEQKFAQSRAELTRSGIIRGDRKKKQEIILDKRILEAKQFPNDTFVYLEAESLPFNKNPFTHGAASTDFSAFKLPQLLVGRSLKSKNNRFQAAIVKSNSEKSGVLCSQIYVCVHVPEKYQHHLEAAWLSYNSKIASYYLLLTSGQLGAYRPKPNMDDLLAVPYPEPRPGLLEGVNNLIEVDKRAQDALGFKDAENALIDDLFNYTLPDFKGDLDSPGRQRTSRCGLNGNNEPHLRAYCDYFMRVLKAGFGKEKEISATIFQERGDSLLPVRLIGIHLDWANREPVVIERIETPTLLSRLQELNDKFLTSTNQKNGGIYYQRIARVYDAVIWNGRRIPTIYIIKPDRIRYWTRSMALRDADEASADIILWNKAERLPQDGEKEVEPG